MCMLKLGLVEPLQQPDNICTGHEQISSERTSCSPIPSPPIQHKTVHTQGLVSCQTTNLSPLLRSLNIFLCCIAEAEFHAHYEALHDSFQPQSEESQQGYLCSSVYDPQPTFTTPPPSPLIHQAPSTSVHLNTVKSATPPPSPFSAATFGLSTPPPSPFPAWSTPSSPSYYFGNFLSGSEEQYFMQNMNQEEPVSAPPPPPPCASHIGLLFGLFLLSLSFCKHTHTQSHKTV